MALVCANDRCRLDVHHDGACDDGATVINDPPERVLVRRDDIFDLLDVASAHDTHRLVYNAVIRLVDNARRDAAVDSA